MKLGVTGASGFLGTEVVAGAVKRGWKVVAFSRRFDAQIEGASEVRQFSDLETIDLTGIDAIIHLSGEPIFGLWTKEKKRKIRESRIGLTNDIVAAMEEIPRAKRPSVFVSASAVGFYGDKGDEWLDEDADAGFGFLADVCRNWEGAATKANTLGVRVVCPRLGIVIGDGGPLKLLRKIFRSGLGGRLGVGDQWMSWIHVKDAARAFLDCVGNEEIRGAVNCVGPTPMTNVQFTEILASALDRKAIFPIPKWVLNRLPGGMGEMFLFSQRVDPVVLNAFGFKWKEDRLDDAIRESLYPSAEEIES